MVNILLVTGTPGSGKTTVSKKIAELSGAHYLDVHALIEGKGIHEGYDDEKKCYIVDVDSIVSAISESIKDSGKCAVVVDSHLSHFLPMEASRRCIVTRCSDLKVLQKRLKQRGYSDKKIRENLDCEIFDVCLQEAKERGHDVIEVDTCRDVDYQKLLETLSS